VRTPRVKLPDGTVRLVKPAFAGRLSGFTLLFEALALILAPQMPFAAVARVAGISPHQVQAICRRYVALALEAADFSTVTTLAIDETSRARDHDYITLAAVAEGLDAGTITTIAAELATHGCPDAQIDSVSIDMSPAFIRGYTARAVRRRRVCPPLCRDNGTADSRVRAHHRRGDDLWRRPRNARGMERSSARGGAGVPRGTPSCAIEDRGDDEEQQNVPGDR